MPIYEYKCKNCEEVSEHIHKISESGPSHCPSCGKEGMSKMISQTSFVLKGGGWYNDAYASKKPAKESKKSPTSDK